MVYVKNVPNWERAVRVLLGAAVAGPGLVLLEGTAGWLVAASAAGFVATGLLGFCPACAMVGRKLK